MKTKTRKLSKTFNILAVASIAAILLGSITFFSEQAYSSDAGGNLVVHYDFEDEVSPTSDVSGHGNDGTLFGGATFSTDVPPVAGSLKSLDLTTPGLLDYLIKNPVAVAPTPFPSTDITTALWVKSSDNADFPIFVSYATGGIAGGNDWGIQNVSPEFEGFVNNEALFTNTAPSVFDGKWHHIAASWQSSDGQMKLYLDGNLINSVLGLKTGESIAGAGSLVLGQEQDSVGGGFHANDDFNGLLDDVRIYDRVLTDAEVKLLVFQGCSSGFWKNDASKRSAVNWDGANPSDDFETELLTAINTLRVKGSGDGITPTLEEALNAKGGKINALARELAAALLNIRNGSINYPLTEMQLTDAFGALNQSNLADIETLRAQLFDLNHAGCTI